MITKLLKGVAVASVLLLGVGTASYAQTGDEPVTITIGKATGAFTQANALGTWAKEWTSTQTDPQVKLSCGNNNMAYYDDANLKLFTNNSSFGFKATYTLVPSEGWAVKSYSFEFTADGENGTVTVKPEGGVAVTATGLTEKQLVNVTNSADSRTASFEVSRSGAQDFARTSNFTITLVKRATAPQHNLMITKAGQVPYRIPALAVAGRSGHLIAVADYRFSKQDIGHGRIDLHVARSENHGEAWTAPTDPKDAQGANVAMGNSGSDRNSAYGDAAIVGDSQSDSLLMLSVSGRVPFFSGLRANPNPVARWYSTDGGKTWTQPEDITEHIYKLFDGVAPAGYIDSMFFGSGRIFQSATVKVGETYRVYAALTGFVKATNTTACWVLYSDDFGQNWKVLGNANNPPVPGGGDEPKVEELPDGNIVISARTGGGRNFNIFTFTNAAKAEGVWGEKYFSRKSDGDGIVASSNACNGEILILPVKRVADNQQMFLALQSVPFGPSNRSKVGINYKELATPLDYNTPANFAKGWDGTKLVSEIGSAYSTMVLQKDEKVGFFYEEETFTNTSGGGYTLVYKKYSVEDITAGQYTYDATSPRPTVDVTLATAADLAKAKELLKRKGLGYPKAQAEERTALEALVTKAENENNVSKVEVEAAINALYKSTDVEMPSAKARYNLTFVKKDGSKAYLNYAEGKLEVKARQEGEELPASAMFTAQLQEDGKYNFLTQDGKYLSYVSDKTWMAQQAPTGVTDAYDANLSPLTIEKISSGNKVEADFTEVYGLLCIKSNRGFHKEKQVWEAGYWIMDANELAFSGAGVPFLTDGFTSALLVELASAPLGATITQLSEVKGNKTYALYNDHFTTYAIKKDGQRNIWAAGMKGDAGHKLSNEDFAKPYDATSPYGAWQLIQDKDGAWYLYNVGAKEFAQSGNPSVFTTKKAIKVTQLAGGFAFTTSGGSQDYLCAAPQLADKPLANWVAADAGAKWVLVENPYVEADLEVFNTLTTISETLAPAPAVRQGIYNLAGQRMQAVDPRQLPAGIYIVNGKKRVVR